MHGQATYERRPEVDAVPPTRHPLAGRLECVVQMTTRNMIALYRPYRSRKRSRLYGLLWPVGDEPNKKKTIHGRASDAFHRLDDGLAFLAGFLTLVPHLGLKRAVPLQYEGEKLMSDAYDFLKNFGDATVSKVRKLRIYEERIVGFVEKVEKDLPRRRLPDLVKLLSSK